MAARLSSVTVAQVLAEKPTTHVVCLSDGTTIGDALRTLAAARVLSAPVGRGSAVVNTENFAGFVDVLSLLALVVREFKRDPRVLHLDQLRMWDRFHELATHITSRPIGSLLPAHGDTATWCCQRTTTLDHLLKSGFLRHASSGAYVHRVPLFGKDGRLAAIVSQTDVVRYLRSHPEVLGAAAEQTVAELSLGSDSVVTVPKDMVAFEAFALMASKHLSAVGVVEDSSTHMALDAKRTAPLLSNLSASDLRGLSFDDFGTLAKPVEHFLLISKSHLNTIRHLPAPVTALRSSSLRAVLDEVIENHVHRVYIVDSDMHPLRVVTLSDILECTYNTGRAAAGSASN